MSAKEEYGYGRFRAYKLEQSELSLRVDKSVDGSAVLVFTGNGPAQSFEVPSYALSGLIKRLVEIQNGGEDAQ